MASIVQARGGPAGQPCLTLLPPIELARSTHLVLLVIDGLGDDWLARRSPDGVLGRHRLGAISSVFPSTTASAITTFLTGDAPVQHGLTGWYTWMGELGAVMMVLPGVPRYGGVSYRKAGIDPVRLFGHRPVFDRISTRSLAFIPNRIARSDFNLSHTGSAQVVAYDGLQDMFRQMGRALRRDRVPKYLYAYWPDLDTIGHDKGMESEEAANHLRQIEWALTDFLVAAAGTDTSILVCADHGQLDTCPEDLIDLSLHPKLEACLALPLCGEPRAAFAYLRSGREKSFLDYCRGALAGLVEVIPSREIRDSGWFGLGPAHPRFDERIGDYCILPTGNRVVRQSLPFEERRHLIGQHGGVSQAEMRVPLCLFRV